MATELLACCRAALRKVLRRPMAWLASPAARRCPRPAAFRTGASMDDAFRTALYRHHQLGLKAERLFGARLWFLLSCYGKLMSGPRSGSYVSGLPVDEQFELVERLANGESVDVHLMHRHVSGNYEASALRWSQGKFLMVFGDREEAA